MRRVMEPNITGSEMGNSGNSPPKKTLVDETVKHFTKLV